MHNRVINEVVPPSSEASGTAPDDSRDSDHSTGRLPALKGGAGHAHIVDGRIPHALIRALRTRHGLGPEIVP